MSAEVMSGGGGSPKLQNKIITPSTSSQIITPDNDYDGLSKVTVNAMPTGALNNPTINSNGLITSSVGTNGYLSSGTSKTLQLSTQGSKTITPGRYSQTAVSSGKYTTGAVTVSGSSNLTAGNIKSGVNIFGVTGTLSSTPIEVRKIQPSQGTTTYTFIPTKFSFYDRTLYPYQIIMIREGYSYKCGFIALQSYMTNQNWGGKLWASYTDWSGNAVTSVNSYVEVTWNYGNTGKFTITLENNSDVYFSGDPYYLYVICEKAPT